MTARVGQPGTLAGVGSFEHTCECTAGQPAPCDLWTAARGLFPVWKPANDLAFSCEVLRERSDRGPRQLQRRSYAASPAFTTTRAGTPASLTRSCSASCTK